MKINGKELEEILRDHQSWLYGDGGECADLSDANLWGANLRGANLWRADLSYANLRGANLSYANLSYANLWGANLWGANLSYADLRDANLSGTNLSYANLSYANLSYANLRGCAGNRQQIKSIFISDKYPITYTADRLQIGCKCFPIKDWWNFSDKKISVMDDGALGWWNDHKDIIKQIIDKHPAEASGHDKELGK